MSRFSRSERQIVALCGLCIFVCGLAFSSPFARAEDVPFPDDSDPKVPVGVSLSPIQISGQAIQISGQAISITGQATSIGGMAQRVQGASLGVQGDSIKVNGGALNISAPGVKVSEDEKEITLEISSDVLFDFDKASIKKEAADALSQVAVLIKRYPGKTVTLGGHTDSKGNDSYNDKLSLRRANSVRDWLVKKGQVSSRYLSTGGYGKRRPVVPNQKPDGSDDPEGRQKNRRVEIKIQK